MKETPLSRILIAAFFIVAIFAMAILTVTSHFTELINSARYMSSLKDYLPEDPDALDMLNARIRSFESEFTEDLFGVTEMQNLNARVQYAMGKQVLSLGSSNMIRLTSGQLYDLTETLDVATPAQKVVRLASYVTEECSLPFLVLYEHPSVYRDDQIPEGYRALDHITENADECVSILRGAGLTVLDSREILPNDDASLSALLYSTDQHWTPLAQFKLAGVIAEKAGLDSSLLDPALFETETHESVFLGKYGQRIGPTLAPPDDICVPLPTYDTNLTRVTYNNGVEQNASGSFTEAAARWGELTPDDGKTYSTMAYRVLGLTEDMDIYTNDNVEGGTVLLLKDSYSAGIGAYLSLTCHTLISVDMRKSGLTVAQYIEQYHPDQVILAYSLRMLTDGVWDFGI